LPFLTLSLLGFYFVLQSYDELPRLSKRLIAKIGISVGLALGVRIGGIIILGYVALLWTCWLLAQWRLKRRATASAAMGDVKEVKEPQPEENPANPSFQTSSPHQNMVKTLAGLSLSFASIVLIAWLVMLIWW